MCRSVLFAIPVLICLPVAARAQGKLTIRTDSLPGGQVNTPYSATLQANGGRPPYVWAITDGTLPPGLTLNAATGAIAGTPTRAGNYPFTAQVTDQDRSTDTRKLSISVAPAAPLVITTGTLPGAIVNQRYTQTLAASGGTPPYQWSISSGALPPGLALDSTTGVIDGTPSSAGNFTFAVQVKDAAGATVVKTFSIAVVPPLAISTASLPAGTAGTAYSQTLAATGGVPPYTWTVSGALPPGLSLSGATISGTPTTAGAWSFTARVADASGTSVSQALAITINPPPLSITSTSLPAGTVGVAYTQALAATGGAPPYTWNVSGTLPPGISLTGATLTGTPTTSGTYRFTARVTDANKASVSQDLSLTINAPTLAITTTSLPAGTVDVVYTQTLAATGGVPPYTWTVSGALPPGLSLSGAIISGTPTTAGAWSFTARVADASGTSASQAFAITINPPALSITTTSLSPGTVGVFYAQTLAAAGGAPPYTWTATGALPAGLTLSGSSITGTPTAAGTTSFTVQVRDSAGGAASRALSITVRAPTLEITTLSLASADAGAAYSQSLTAGGGTPPYAWTLSGTLPPGLTLTGSTITGSPSASGSYSFTIEVADAGSQTDSRSFSLTVRAALAITTASLPDAAVGAAYSQTLQASGGTPPYTWSVASGALPDGLTLNTSTGLLSGVPRTGGVANFTVRVRDSAGREASRAYRIDTAVGLIITTAPVLPAGTAGSRYEQPLAAAGGRTPYTWSVTEGALPGGIALDASTGVLAGTPTASGAFAFTARVADGSASVATKAFTLSIAATLVISTAPELPGGGSGAAYAQPLSAAGGSPPYAWSITAGALPPGVQLDPVTGMIAGTPSAAGAFAFTARVTDSLSTTASKDFSLRVFAGLTVISAAPARAILGAQYSHTLAGSGGAAPYSWAVVAGALPPGLALDPGTGIVAGTPSQTGTFDFTVQLRDAAGLTASAARTIAVDLPPLPAVSLTGGADTLLPLQQPAVAVSLDASFPAAIDGELVLAFDSDAAIQADDPAIQFSTGGRRAAFTIPAGATAARFAVPAIAFQTGTVAGTIRLTVAMHSGDTDVTPGGGALRTMRINRAEPKILAAALARTASGFELRITGLATGRELTSATVKFQASPGGNLDTAELTVPLADLAARWYQDPAGMQFGSQFLLVLPFTVNGDPRAIESVTVTLNNQTGTSEPVTARF